MSGEIRSDCPGGHLLLKAALGLRRSLPSVTAKPYNRAAEGKKEARAFKLKEVPFKSSSTETNRRKFFWRGCKKSSTTVPLGSCP